MQDLNTLYDKLYAMAHDYPGFLSSAVSPYQSGQRGVFLYSLGLHVFYSGGVISVHESSFESMGAAVTAAFSQMQYQLTKVKMPTLLQAS